MPATDTAPAPDRCEHTRPTREAGTVIREVQAWRLPSQEAGLPAGLPREIAAVATPPAGPEWAEHRERYALCLVGDGGLGWHGPVSAPVVQVIRDDHAAGLIGHDAAQHRRLPYRRTTGRHRGGPHARQAVSAIELACWDLASAASGQSVVDLLGGQIRSHIPAYASALGLDPAHPAAAEAAGWIAEAGFWGQKWPLTKQLILAGPRAVADMLGRLREAAGDGPFMVDGLGRCHLDDALRLLPVLADLQVHWAEELVPAGSWSWQRLRSTGSKVPLAAGEHAVDEAEQTRLLTGGQVDVWQIDVGWCGGLGRALHTVETATDLGIPVFPHGAHLNAALALAAACCRDKIPAVEYHLTVEPLRQQIHETTVTVDGGWLTARTAAGLAERLLTVGDDPAWSVSR